MKSHYIFTLTIGLILSVIIFIISCSREVSKLYTVQPDTYLSPKYEDKSFTNVSMDICYPILDFDNPPEGADTAHINNMKVFDEAFKKYFPDGIKTFSSITKTGWIYFDMMKYFGTGEIIEYLAKRKDCTDFYISLADSISFFQKQSNADFLFILQMAAVALNPADTSNPKSKYSTILDHEYSIWDRKTGDLITKDKVSAKMEFDRISGNWPYRGAVMKTAALIFEKLPMFQK